MNGAFLFGRVENIVAKGENAGYQLFLHFHKDFKRVFYPCKVSMRNKRSIVHICLHMVITVPLINCLKDVQCRFKDYASHIMAIALILHVCPGLHQLSHPRTFP